jgi:hypothetical protein
MPDLFPNRWLRRTTLLCVVLLCVTGLAQALHNHTKDVARGDADKTRCTVCVAGQSPQQAAAKVDVQPAEAKEIALQPQGSRHLSRVGDEASRIRPPPSR